MTVLCTEVVHLLLLEVTLYHWWCCMMYSMVDIVIQKSNSNKTAWARIKGRKFNGDNNNVTCLASQQKLEKVNSTSNVLTLRL